MGRYRPLVSAIVQHVNTVSRETSPIHIFEDIYLVPNEWQVLEYIVEHRDDDKYMNNMIQDLAIPQSSFSRIQKKLCDMGLIGRYQTTDNKKNIILKPTELAVKAYDYHTKETYQKIWKPFFDALEGCSDDELERFTAALHVLSGGVVKDDLIKKTELIKLD